MTFEGKPDVPLTFEEWFNAVEDEDVCSVSEIVWHHGPHKGRDVAIWLEEAYEAGRLSESICKRTDG